MLRAVLSGEAFGDWDFTMKRGFRVVGLRARSLLLPLRWTRGTSPCWGAASQDRGREQRGHCEVPSSL